MTRALPLAIALALTVASALAAMAQTNDPAAAPAPQSEAPAGGNTATPPPVAMGTPSSPEATAKARSAAGSLSPMIEDVQIVGPWSSGDKQGVWRTVMVQSPEGETKFHFFVQQLQGSGADLTLTSSTEIPEINQMKGAVVGYRADEPSEEDPTSLTLFFDILPTDGEIAETYELNYFPNAPYEFGPASN